MDKDVSPLSASGHLLCEVQNGMQKMVPAGLRWGESQNPPWLIFMSFARKQA